MEASIAAGMEVWVAAEGIEVMDLEDVTGRT